MLVTSVHGGKLQIVSFTLRTQFYVVTFFLRGDALAHTASFMELEILTTVLNESCLYDIPCQMWAHVNTNNEVKEELGEIQKVVEILLT